MSSFAPVQSEELQWQVAHAGWQELPCMVSTSLYMFIFTSNYDKCIKWSKLEVVCTDSWLPHCTVLVMFTYTDPYGGSQIPRTGSRLCSTSLLLMCISFYGNATKIKKRRCALYVTNKDWHGEAGQIRVTMVNKTIGLTSLHLLVDQGKAHTSYKHKILCYNHMSSITK